MLQGKQIIETVQKALDSKDGGEAIKSIARENPNYLAVWVKHANLTKTQLDLQIELVTLTMALIISTPNEN